jgi:hypothetical protein
MVKLPALVLAVVWVAGTARGLAADAVTTVLACHIANVVKESVPAEGNAAIMEAKKEHPDLGGTVYLYLHNSSPGPVTVQGVSWDGADVSTRLGGPDYGVMWWRCAPTSIPAGAEAEITINLRESLRKDTPFTVDLGEAGKVHCQVALSHIGPTLATVAFTPDLGAAYLYVDLPGGDLPNDIYINGSPAGRSVALLGKGRAAGLAVLKVTPSGGFKQGERYLFRIGAGQHGCAGSIRAFGDLARFGTYGFANPDEFSAAGLDAYASFTALDAEALSQHGRVGMKAAMIIGFKTPEPSVVGNPSIYAYVAMDEPDCYDYSKDETRPMHKRLGTFAQPLVEWAGNCETADRLVPTSTTLDLTFAPQNYFTYAKVADIANPDCYTVTSGWPLTAFRDKVSMIKRASAPQPFTMTYQGYWEEYATPVSTWMSPAMIAEKGSENMVDRTRIRGFGRAPAAEEVRIPMLYGVGGGGRGLFCYLAATEAMATQMDHSVMAMPELWQEVTRTTRELRTVAPLIQLSHPMIWSKASQSSLWTTTLICGEQAALVVAVNEACRSEKDAFTPSPVLDTTFSFPDLPWLRAERVYGVGDGKLERIKSRKHAGTLTWTVGAIDDGSIYLVCSDKRLADRLLKEYASKSTHITAAGLKVPEEGHLKGRRKTPQQ